MRPLIRSLLFLPASNARALAKARTLPADALAFDLEDAVAPEAKGAAREALVAALREGGFGARRLYVRINGLDSPDCDADLAALKGLPLRGIIAPKVNQVSEIEQLSDKLATLAVGDDCRLMIMVETPAAALALPALAAAGGRLGGLILGLNDLSLASGIPQIRDRAAFVPLFLQTVLAARANGLVAIDAVCNALDDPARLAAEAAQARSFGFDGKSVIHPSQIEPVNDAFAPTEEELTEARAIVAAFADPANAGLGAIRLDGRMVEDLHRRQAEDLLARAAAIRPSGQA